MYGKLKSDSAGRWAGAQKQFGARLGQKPPRRSMWAANSHHFEVGGESHTWEFGVKKSPIQMVWNDLKEKSDLLEISLGENTKLQSEVTQLKGAVNESSQEVVRYRAKCESLKTDLDGLRSSKWTQPINPACDHVLREEITAVLKDDFNLIQGLTLVSRLFGDRVVVLETAFASAKDSVRSSFKQHQVALDLLLTLVTDYWSTLAEGNGDQAAKAHFGVKEYAAKEAQTLTTTGKRQRTFAYGDKSVFMEKHLKIGYKNCKAEVLRVHFEWMADEKKIVIGHCGSHLAL